MFNSKVHFLHIFWAELFLRKSDQVLSGAFKSLVKCRSLSDSVFHDMVIYLILEDCKKLLLKKMTSA